jgi:CheY-like chemotaxis protein/nitrogen-specific signal transduction histidine kinase
MDQLDLLARKAAVYVQRARAEDARRESEARLREADRRKDEFLAVLAHELRNPLAPIRNAVGFLQIKGSSDPDVVNARELIGRQVKHMVRLVDDLLDVSRVTLGQIQLQKEVVSLGLALTNAAEASRPLLDAAQHHLAVSLPPEPVYVEGDVTRLAQIFQNLLNNAAKYTPAGGRVEISASLAGARVRVAIRDNGIGIRPDMLERVFEMFTQVERSGTLTQGGLGIGLSLAQRLANMHGGHIEARSAGEGRGSEFTVVLPTCGAPALTRGAADRGAALRGAARRVLVVDDNVDAAESLRLIVELNGHDVRTAFDGEAALSVAADFRPDIVFLDIGMPKMDGFAVCRRLRDEAWGRELKIVALTGWGQDGDRHRTAQAGFDHHLVKPADPSLLATMIAETQSRAAVH